MSAALAEGRWGGGGCVFGLQSPGVAVCGQRTVLTGFLVSLVKAVVGPGSYLPSVYVDRTYILSVVH